jgi:putative DNA primase/helicase
MTPQEVLNRHGVALGSYGPGQHYTTCPECSKDRKKPGHKANKCLSVLIGPGDKVVWNCHHCGWSGPPKGSGERTRDEWPAFVYRDAGGVERFRKVRRPPKNFFIQHPDGKGGWAKGAGGADLTLIYRANEVADAIKAGREIAVVEGEKDADNCWRLDIPATCNAHGASEPGKAAKWKKAHSEQLAGGSIVIFNDNDAAGYAHADTICKLSIGVAKRVRRLDLKPHWPEIPKGGDVSDWLAVGGEHTPERLRELIAAAPEFQAKAEATPPIDDDAEIERLARLPAFEYERGRAGAAKALGVRSAMLDKLVAAKRAELGLNEANNGQGRPIEFVDPEPWPEEVDGDALLDQISNALKRHIILSEAARHLAALWIVHTYLLDCFLISPRLAVCSPVKRCGKTTLLDVLGRLVLRPQAAASVTSAVTFRLIEMHRPCLLIDEADTFLKENEELRGILNSGHRRGGAVLRSVGDDHEPRAFATYGACAIALIGALPDTLADRSIAVNLKRRLASEKIESFRLDRTDHLDQIARQIARWTSDNAEAVRSAEPQMPPGVFNREADNLQPLLAIAERAGGEWPERARKAAVDGRQGNEDEASRLELLLGDIRDVFTEKKTESISSADLIGRLVEITPRPWAEYGRSGKPLTQNKLARLLKPLGIGPDRLKDGDDRARGYFLTRFDEPFKRYLTPQASENGSSKCPSVHEPINTGTSATSQSVRDPGPRTDAKVPETQYPSHYGHLDTLKAGNGQARGMGLSERQFDEPFKRYLSPKEGGSNLNTSTKAATTGISGHFETSTANPCVEVQKSQKPNNDGLCLGVEVGKGENGQARGMGLSERDVDEGAEWLCATASRLVGDPDADAKLDRGLREWVWDRFNVPFDSMEIELARIMERAFAPL